MGGVIRTLITIHVGEHKQLSFYFFLSSMMNGNVNKKVEVAAVVGAGGGLLPQLDGGSRHRREASSCHRRRRPIISVFSGDDVHLQPFKGENSNRLTEAAPPFVGPG